MKIGFMINPRADVVFIPIWKVFISPGFIIALITEKYD